MPLKELIDVYEEVCGTWATRHGDLFGPEEFDNFSKHLDNPFEFKGKVQEALEFFDLVSKEAHESKENCWLKIKAKFNKLVIKLHPDKNPPEKKTEFERKFNKLMMFYKILSEEYGPEYN